MSSRNFIRRFKEATGLPPLEYLQRMRVRATPQLLEERHASVQEVSAAVGYDDLAFFRNLFKRHTGHTPADCQRRSAGA
ncbi:MAG: helix-turn-helix domain-containing protein [Myxococcota bacterium]